MLNNDRFKEECTKRYGGGKITIDQGLCKACELCLTVCPDEAIRLSSLNDKGLPSGRILQDSCRGCALCASCARSGIGVYRG